LLSLPITDLEQTKMKTPPLPSPSNTHTKSAGFALHSFTYHIFHTPILKWNVLSSFQNPPWFYNLSNFASSEPALFCTQGHIPNFVYKMYYLPPRNLLEL
jgi:hypothetical protein